MSASPARPPLWSPQQREWLQALGHAPLTLAVSDAPVAAAPSRPEPASAPMPQPRLASETAQAPREAAAARPTVDHLQRALLRATGLPEAEAARALQALCIDAAALRADPAAKRVLWTRLRRLRGSRPA